MNIQKISIDKLRPAEYNPRRDLQPGDEEYEKLRRSIDEFGCVEPVIWNSRTGNVVGGHQRLKVLIESGETETDCVVVNLEPDREKALNIALNKISGTWDEEKLAQILSDMSAADFDMSLTGFDAEEIESLLQEFGGDEAEDDNFDAESAYGEIDEPFTRPGDIWLLGGHRVMCGDSCNPADVAALMSGESAKLAITDPPYNVNYESAAGKIENDNLSADAFHAFLYDAFENMYDNMKPGAALYVFHADSEGINFRTAFCESGFDLKQCLIWVKNHFCLGRQDYQWKHEPILYGWKPGAAHYFIEDYTQSTVIDNCITPDIEKMTKAELVEYAKSLQQIVDEIKASVIYCEKPQRSEDHPTMKPVPLVGKLMKNSSQPGWIALDLFGGSGSTLIAAEQLDRKSRLMELDPKYTDVIVKRYIAFCKEKGQEPVAALVRNGAKVAVDTAIFE